MVSIISFVRRNKSIKIEDLLDVIKEFDGTIITSSIHIALVKLFENHFSTLNERRLYELLHWTNSMFGQLPPTRNVEINMSKIRSLIKQQYGYDSTQYTKAKIHLVYDRAEKNKQINEYASKVYERCNDQSPVKISMVNKIMEYKDSNDWKKNVIFLLLASGSRMKEIVEDGKFSADPENEHNVLLSNIAKSKSKTRKISKPILGNRENFLRILLKVRSMALNLASTNILVNKELKKLIGESSYALRRWYGTVSYELLADTKKIAKTSWLSSVLGHDGQNTDTAICYQNYYVDNDEEPNFISRAKDT